MAMGRPMASQVANLYMQDFEESHIFNNHIYDSQLTTWLRYIDDIFLIWCGSLEGLKESWSGSI